MSMQNLRMIHRAVTLFIVLFALFFAVTGTLVQIVDMRSILFHYPARDPNVQAMHEAYDGPPDFVVRSIADYEANPLPAGFDYRAALPRVVAAARALAPTLPLTYVEFRMVGATPVGQVGIGTGHARIDPASGTLLERTEQDKIDSRQPRSLRNTFKHLHRMSSFGSGITTYLNVMTAIGLATLVVTGIILYWKLYKTRARMGKSSLFWSAGGTWRMLHRSISVVAALFLSVVVLSGCWIVILGMVASWTRNDERRAEARLRDGPRTVGVGPDVPAQPGFGIEQGSDGRLPAMLNVTLASLNADAPGVPVKLVRLRYYANYPQGVVVTGGGDQAQRVYNAATGKAMSESEPGYPPVKFIGGWDSHQIAKSVHRGDYFGLTGRWMAFLSGFALIYLSVSGIQMYWAMWRRRQQAGRGALLWR